MEIVYTLLRGALAVLAIIAFTRMNGLRSFSKMSGFDFAVTVAMGSVLATVVMADTSTAFWTNLAALAAFFVVQGTISRFRARFPLLQNAMDNAPLMLMENGRILDHNLIKGQVSHGDLMGKLREANAIRFEDVHAVILEDTGDVSVLHGSGSVDARLLEGVRR